MKLPQPMSPKGNRHDNKKRSPELTAIAASFHKSRRIQKGAVRQAEKSLILTQTKLTQSLNYVCFLGRIGAVFALYIMVTDTLSTCSNESIVLP